MFTGTLSLSTGHIPPPVLKIEPGDVIIFSSPHSLTPEAMKQIQQGGRKSFPGCPVMVLADGLTITTARNIIDTLQQNGTCTREQLRDIGILTPGE
jgi:hypothetical protein